MRRLRNLWLLGLVIGGCAVGCSKRPLPAEETPTPPWRADAGARDAPVFPDAAGPFDVPPSDASDASDAQPDAADATDAPADRIDAADAPPDAPPDVPDAADGPTDRPPETGPEVPPRPDAGCAGNGRPRQPAPLFGPPVTIPIPGGHGPGGANANSIGIGDVTGDGRADVVIGSYHPALIVYPQLADGTLGTPAAYPIAPGPLGHPALLDIGDLNGDGRPDVVYNREDGIGFMPGNPAGGLGPEQVLPPPAGTTAWAQLEIADMNGDGRSDLVVMPYLGAGGLVEVRLQRRENGAGFLTTVFARCPSSAYHSMAIGDVNGDGRPDIALADYDRQICLLHQRGDGTFEPNVLSPGVQVRLLGIGAFGEAGCGPAIAIADSPAPQLGLMSQTPPGMWLPPKFQFADNYPEHMVVTDVDGDGREDVVVLHLTWEKVGVFRAAPGGGLAGEETYPFPWTDQATDGLAVGDINSDGRPDIVSADFDLAILYHR